MKKPLKSLVAIIAIFLIVCLCLTACSTKDTTLEAPKNLRVINGKTARWNPVEGCSNYLIFIDGEEVDSSSRTSYDLSQLNIMHDMIYELQVQAEGDGKTHSSELSDIVLFSLSGTQGSTQLPDNNNSNNNNNGNNNNNENSTSGIITDFEIKYDECRAQPAAPSTGTIPKIIDSYTDKKNNYFLLDVGYIKNTFISSLAQLEYTGVGALTLTRTTIESNEIINSLTQTISESHSISHSAGAELGVEFEGSIKTSIGVKISAKFNYNYTNTSTNGKSTSETTSTAKTYASQLQFSFTIGDKNEIRGHYRVALYAIVDVYYIIKTSLDNQTLESLEVVPCARPNSYFYRVEYSANGIYNNEPLNTISFENGFYRTYPTSLRFVEEIPTYGQTYKIDANLKNCEVDNGFNPNRPSSDLVAREEVDPNLYNIVLNGVAKKTNDKYTIVDNLEIGFKLLQDPNNINITHCSGSSLYKAELNSDSYSDKIYNTTINKEIKKCAVYIKINYADNTSQEKYATDIFATSTNNSYVDILSVTGTSIGNKKINSITIVGVYELKGTWKGFLSIDNYTYTNWRTENTFYFE